MKTAEELNPQRPEQFRKHIVEERESGQNGVGGHIAMSEDVVASIAGVAARDVAGIHSLGKSRLISFRDNPERGVAAEVGDREAALDLEVVIKHGSDIRQMAEEIRTRVADQVNQMAGRTVVEENLEVVGVHMPEAEAPKKETPSRVR